ncbi:MAG: hypothetical protein HY558_06695 [Euryarchaeota archaeon]|nr:hypothetical protein [Euryarchaeota archaeon]
MEELGLCALCGTPGKMYTCRLCGQNVCIYCTNFRYVCHRCAQGRRGDIAPGRVLPRPQRSPGTRFSLDDSR